MIKEIVFGEKLEGFDYVERPGVYGIALNEQVKSQSVKHQRGIFSLVA